VYIEPSYAPSPTSFKEYPGFDKCVTDSPNPCKNNPSRPQEVEILKSLRKNNRKRGKPSLRRNKSSTVGDFVAVSEIFQGSGFRG
jgi:hypothetical protein